MVPCFLKTKDNIIWFAINKINDEYLCFPKYINNYKGKKYTEWFDYKNNILKKYLKIQKGLDEKVYLVSEKDIFKFYSPTKFLQELDKKTLNYDFNKKIYDIVCFISKYFGINQKFIGVEGSLLLNKYKENSDIDILVYGIENAKKIQKNFFTINKSNQNIRLFSKEESMKYIKDRMDCGFGKNLNLSLKQFKRRFYGFTDDTQFSIVCVPIVEKDGYIDLNRQIKFIENYEGILTISNDYYSCIVPSIYKGIDDNGAEYKIEIFNHYGINQAKVGEKVYIKGKAYEDLNSGEKIIILSFWSGLKERFDLYE